MGHCDRKLARQIEVARSIQEAPEGVADELVSRGRREEAKWDEAVLGQCSSSSSEEALKAVVAST